ncbi:hypothetical protein D3C80_1824010 [compost metagenome]
MNGGKAVFQAMDINAFALQIDIGKAPAVDLTDTTSVDKTHPNQTVIAFSVFTLLSSS